jgi:hypothetical protein
MTIGGKAAARRLVCSAAGALCILLAPPLGGAADPHHAPNEAALLYETYCRACHDEQVHWRAAKRARNWTLLVAEVRRWQRNLDLGWTEAEIRQVAHYLNVRYYRFPASPPRMIVRAG